MAYSRFQQLMQGQTGIARKVYWCLPLIDEAFPLTVYAINSIYAKEHGKMLDTHILSGCLNSLSRAGLAFETSDQWYRQKIRPKRAYTRHAPPKHGDVEIVTPAPEVPDDVNLDDLSFDDDTMQTTVEQPAPQFELAIEMPPSAPLPFEERLDLLAQQLLGIGQRISDLATEMAVAKKAETEQAEKLRKIREIMGDK